MKVLLVSSGSGSRGGGEIYLTLLAQGLIEAGCEVSVLVPELPIMDELAAQFPDSAQVERFPFRSTYQRKFRGIGASLDRAQQASVSELFRANAPDIVHVNQQVAEDGLDLLRAAALSGLPWVSTVHVARSAASLEAKLGGLRDLVAHRALRRAGGRFITVSNASRQQLVQRLARGSVKVDVVHNGVLSATPDQYEIARREARASWDVKDDDVVFGMVGRIEAQKNPLALIDYVADAGLADQVKVVWIGDGALRGELERHAEQRAVSLLVDGWRQDARTRLAGFDAFLLPSKFEGLPLAILEAMHAGLPVIASNADGIPEAVEQGVTGFLCETPSDWQQAVQSLARDKDLRTRISHAARDAAATSFSVAAMAKRTLELYRLEAAA